MRRRRRTHFSIAPSQIAKLEEWRDDVNSHMLFFGCRGIRKTAQDFSAELLDTICGNGIPTIWSLSSTNDDDELELSTNDILASLAIQALILNQKVLSNDPPPLTSQFNRAVSEDHFLQLLRRCLSGTLRIYIILDLVQVNKAANHNRSQANAFIWKLYDLLRDREEGGIKLVVVAQDSEMCIDIDDGDMTNFSQIVVTGQSPGGSNRRRIARYSSHASRSGQARDPLPLIFREK